MSHWIDLTKEQKEGKEPIPFADFVRSKINRSAMQKRGWKHRDK